MYTKIFTAHILILSSLFKFLWNIKFRSSVHDLHKAFRLCIWSNRVYRSMGARNCQQCDQGHGSLPLCSVPGCWGKHRDVHHNDCCHEEKGDCSGCRPQEFGLH